MKPELKKRLLQILIIFGFFLLLSVYYSTETLIVFMKKGLPTTFWEQLETRLLQWMPWAILTLFVLKFAKKYPVDLKKWHSVLPIHILSGLFFALIHAVLYMFFVFTFVRTIEWNIPDMYITLLAKSVHFNLLVYAIIISLWNMWDYYRRNKENELRTSQLEAQLSQAQLDVLRMQLNPHFLFNTLHMIVAHVRKDPEAAESMISRLSDLFRKTLEVSDSQEIPLKEELEYLRIYLEIQESRFKDRLKSEFNIDPKILDVMVPNLILQPVVENAVRYAVAPQAEGGKISILSRREGDTLLLEIKDSGPGFPEDKESLFESGFGLNNTRKRLSMHYGNQYLFSLENAEGGGALVRLGIPIRKHKG
jgi:sensor histidine kinase YesM